MEHIMVDVLVEQMASEVAVSMDIESVGVMVVDWAALMVVSKVALMVVE